MTINVGIVGYGMAAQTFHLPLLSALVDFQIQGFCSSQADALSKAWPTASVLSTVDELAALQNLDLVVITSPSSMHYEHAKVALLAGKHVVVEKPFTLNTERAEELFELARQHNVKLTVFHNRRWDGDFLTLQKLLRNNTLGDIRFCESHFDRFRPVVRDRWRENAGPGSGVLYDLGPHLIDQVLCLFGKPKAVTATLRALRENAEADDYMHLQLHYPNLEVVLHADMLSAVPNPRFKLQGDKGTYIKFGLDPQENQLKQGKDVIDDSYGAIPHSEDGLIYGDVSAQQETPTRYPTEKGCYLAFYQQLAEAINNDAELPINQIDIVNVMRIIDAAQQSQQQGKTITL